MKSFIKNLLVLLVIITGLILFGFYFFAIGIPNSITDEIKQKSCSGIVVSISVPTELLAENSVEVVAKQSVPFR